MANYKNGDNLFNFDYIHICIWKKKFIKKILKFSFKKKDISFKKILKNIITEYLEKSLWNRKFAQNSLSENCD